MKPADVDDLADELWSAMVGHMQREAEAINKKTKATTRLPVAG